MDWSSCFFQVVSPLAVYLGDKDLVRLLLVNASFSAEFQSVLGCMSSSGVQAYATCSSQGIGARSLAARKLRFWWRKCLLIRWLNETAKDASQKHLYPHRTQTNFLPLQRSLSLQRSDGRYLSRRSWRALSSLCPVCGVCEIRATLFYHQLCELMSRTIPFLYVGCQSCVNRQIPRLLPDNRCYMANLEEASTLQNFLDSLG